MTTPRFPQLDDADLDERQREVVAQIVSGPRGAVKGPFQVLLHHPELALRLQHLGEHLRFGTGLPPELVELVILLTARHWTSQYEWQAHRRIALTSTPLPAAVIDAIAQGERPQDLSPELDAAYVFARECLTNGEPSDASYQRIEELFGRKGVLDIIALCGYYGLLACVLNTSRLPLPDNMPPPLQPLAAR